MDSITERFQPIQPVVSRRERIATAALQGFLSQEGGLLKDYISCASKYAEASAAMADALIAELDKPAEGSATE